MSNKIKEIKASNWLNSSNKVLQHVMHFLCFRVSPGSAEALVRWGE